MNSYEVLPPDQLKSKLPDVNGSHLIDVRDFDEFEAVHVQGAECVPLPQLLRRASAWAPDDSLMLICHQGDRAREAADHLRGAGFARLAVVDGGTKACVAAGVPVVRGRKRIPLQRQVLIGAGLVTLTGLTLALVNPWLILISWFAASMLVVAGFSGFCPMARILALAPWNRLTGGQGSDGESACSTKGGCA